MKSIESINRSEELTKKAIPFLNYKKSYFNSVQEANLCTKKDFLAFFKASDDDWIDWQWHMKNRITHIDQLKELFKMSADTIQEIKSVSLKYRWAITPYYLSLIRIFNPSDPIFLQCIPQILELDEYGKEDPMSERQTNPAGIITRRYPDRVIINTTNCCASFCRHCQRKRNIGDFDLHCSIEELNESIEYIKNHPEIRDVLVTGGDPFTFTDNQIELLLKRLREIPSVEIIRFGTRTLVTLPQRITENLIYKMKKYSPIYINTQFNHPQEITPESIKACNKLANQGFVLGNQMVFLKHINDDSNVVQLLNQLLLKQRVRPYYIFHPKDVIGTKHLSISLKSGIEIYSKLRGNTSGLAIPTYVYNSPNGLGKISLSSAMLENVDSEGNINLKTWENKTIHVPLE